MQSWILSGLAAIFFINGFWLMFMGGYAEKRTSLGKFKTYEFEKSPIGFSIAVGLLLVLGMTCLHVGNPQFFPILVKKAPQLKYLYTVAKMQNGVYYLLGGGLVSCSIFSFIFRRLIIACSTFTKGHDLDLDPRAIRAHEAITNSETPDWQRDAERKSQWDDGTPM